MTEEYEIGRTPDYKLRALDTRNERRGNVGAAWKNRDGSIRVVIDPCVVLNGNDTHIVLTLFVNDYDPEIAKTYRRNKRKEPNGQVESNPAPETVAPPVG